MAAHILYRGVYMEKLKIYIICSVTLICVFLFGGLVYTAFDDTQAVPASIGSGEDEPVIVIDAGHGGEDSGAVANGLLEKDINLSIALKLRDMLRLSGYKVVMTREDDISIYDNTASTTREKKNSDLKNRVSIINGNKNNILVSIHQNKFEQEKYSGTQMFYSANDPQSERLAEEMRRSVTGLLQPENKRELKEAGKNIYILRQAEVPAVIVECGFLSNNDEAALLKTDAYQQKMAFSICCGMINYLKSRK